MSQEREGRKPLLSAKGNFYSLIMERILQDREREQLGPRVLPFCITHSLTMACLKPVEIMGDNDNRCSYYLDMVKKTKDRPAMLMLSEGTAMLMLILSIRFLGFFLVVPWLMTAENSMVGTGPSDWLDQMVHIHGRVRRTV